LNESDDPLPPPVLYVARQASMPAPAAMRSSPFLRQGLPFEIATHCFDITGRVGVAGFRVKTLHASCQ
jgi:hypothetical protein